MAVWVNFYISDLHFGHANVIEMDGRPFENTEHMEEVLVANWNGRVTNKDTVHVLGDFCWGKKDEWIRILRRLKGQKVLIKGNHDLKNYPPELLKEFTDIKDYKEIIDNGNDNGNRRVIMSHYPSPFYRRNQDGRCYMLCGHIRPTAENDALNQIIHTLRATSDNKAQIINVGCMMPYMDYTPRTLQEIVPAWEAHQTKVGMDLIRNAKTGAERNYFAEVLDARLQKKQKLILQAEKNQAKGGGKN